MGPCHERTWTDKTSEGYTISWTLSRLDRIPGLSLKMNFINGSSQSVTLKNFDLCATKSPALSVKAAPEKWFLSTLATRSNPGSGFLSQEGSKSFGDFLTLFYTQGGPGLFFGPAGLPISDVRYDCQVAGGRLGLRIISEMNSVLVDPGESRDSQEVVVLFGPYHEILPRMFQWMAKTHGARLDKGSLFGWCSWLSMWGNPTEKRVDAVLNVVKDQRDSLPLQYFQIDDGWEVCYGNWTPDLKLYPNGMKPIAQRIAAAGLMPGIWMTLVNGSEDGSPHPDGSPVGIGGGPLVGKGKNMYSMDATHPGTRKFIRDNLQARYDEGFRYFKLDFNRPRFGPDRYDKKLTHLQMMRGLFKLYRDAIGEDCYLCACVGQLERGALGYADAMRIGPDTMLEWKPISTTGPDAGTPKAGGPFPDAMSAIGNMALANGILFAADPDAYYTKIQNANPAKNGISDATLDAFISYVGFLGGLRQTCDELSRPLYKSPAVMYRLQIMSTPLVERSYAFDHQTDLWHSRFGFVAQRKWGNSIGVILLNPKDEPADVSLAGLPLSRLTKTFHVWSFWDKKYYDCVDASLVIPQLPAHSCVQLRLSDAGVNPVELVGSTLHIGMGVNEVQDFTVANNQVQITLNDQGARDGELLLVSGQNLRLAEVSGCKATLSHDPETKLYHLSIKERQRGAKEAIKIQY